MLNLITSKAQFFSFSLVNVGIKAVPSEKVTITACFSVCFPLEDVNM